MKKYLLLGLFAASFVLNFEANAAEEASLRETFAKQFLVGVALDGYLPRDYNANELALIHRQFATITPANCMKMQSIQRKEGEFRFEMGDALVTFAAANDLKVCGHCLLWAKDERTYPWFFKDGDKTLSKEQLLARVQKHIDTVAGHYKGKVISWDVVNEALDDGSTNYLRPSQWVTICGEEFIAKSFEYAHKADPDAMLVYNDYNVDIPAKRAKLIRLLKSLLDQKVPVHAVGIQGHWEIDAVPFKNIEDTIVEVQKLGLKVLISELDIDVVPRGAWWADGGKRRDELSKFDPYKAGCPPELLQRQAEQYAKLFEIFRRHSEAIARITFWDLHDGRSWLNHFPWERTDYPLLFDRNAQPKPAFKAVIETH